MIKITVNFYCIDYLLLDKVDILLFWVLDLFQIKNLKSKRSAIALRRKLMNVSAQLTLEQQFKLQILTDQVKDLSQEQAQEYLIEMFRQMMVKDNLMKHLLKNA